MYRTMGYQQVEVPWIVAEQILHLTSPITTPHLLVKPEGQTKIGGLIGSGEQGLLAIREQLKIGKWMTLTPCFRVEPKYDNLYKQQFIKIELMEVLDPKEGQKDWFLKGMISNAVRVMSTWERDVKLVETKDGFDLQVNEIEVGSYGLRQWGDFHWIYGTGLAEPRFSVAVGVLK